MAKYPKVSLLLTTARKIRKWVYRNVVRWAYRGIRKRLLVFVPFWPPSKRFLVAQGSAPDYIVWGVIDWHFRHQRPQQLSRKISETGRRVFYVSSNFRADMRSGFEVEPLDTSGRLFQVTLFVEEPPIIYFAAPPSDATIQLRRSIGSLLQWARVKRVISIVQHAFWYDIANVIPNNRLIYDCIDHHEGFGNNADSVLLLERRILEHADLTVTTSEWLDEFAAKYTCRRTLIRNACDYEHFSRKPEVVYEDIKKRPIIGYYGAIASWFDQDLIEAVARRFTDCSILLIGADTTHAQRKLAHLHNVTFVGEVAYSELPYFLYSFDVAILPFKLNDLTLATNPVKIYEYLAAGKPVVSVKLPEMKAFRDLVCTADSTADFLVSLDKVLGHQASQSELAARKEFASGQTWHHRAEQLVASAETSGANPFVSIIVVTYNNLELTRHCLCSIALYSDYENFEIIVVDNASRDGSRDFLGQWSRSGPNRRIVLNETNKGFAAANNQGLAIAKGEYFVLLNNDTYVTPGWIETLYRHLERDSKIGLIGPVTNNIGNEARINTRYRNMEEMLKESEEYRYRHLGEVFQIRTIAFFCVMMHRRVFDVVGPLDEEFGLGFFEDDDYCRRVENAGLKIVCAEDVFVHHHLSASFSKLDMDVRRSLFNDNRKKYESKWGPWQPHVPRKRTFWSVRRD